MPFARARTQVIRRAREFALSLLFLPMLLTLAALLLFATTAILDRTFFPDEPPSHGLGNWQFLVFAGSPSASQSLLSTVASMFAGITGVVFSVTLVALSLAATKYSAQVVPQFESDRLNQLVLGAFIGTVVYSLLVLKTVRTSDASDTFTPVIGTNVTVVLAITSLFLLVLFINNLASYIQPKQFVDNLSERILENSKVLYGPEGVPGFHPHVLEGPWPMTPGRWEGAGCVTLKARSSGYLQEIDWRSLKQALGRIPRHRGGGSGAEGEGEWEVEVAVPIGKRVSKGQTLARLRLPGAALPEGVHDDLAVAFHLQGKRTVEGDPTFGITSLSDIALTAMSGGSTDVGVAEACMREQLALAHQLAAAPDPHTRFHLRLATMAVRLTRPVHPIGETILEQARRIHDKALKEGYAQVLEEEMIGSADLLEEVARVGNGPRQEAVVAWVAAAFEDACANLPDTAALERMATRLGTTLREVQSSDGEEGSLLPGLEKALHGAIEHAPDPAVRQRLAAALSVGDTELTRGSAPPA